jgi:hypothetical protein
MENRVGTVQSVVGDENEYLGFPIYRLFTDLKLVNMV